MERLDDGIHILIARHLQKPKPTRFTTAWVSHYACIHHLAILAKFILKFLIIWVGDVLVMFYAASTILRQNQCPRYNHHIPPLTRQN